MKIKGRLAAARISAVLSIASSHGAGRTDSLLPEEWLADSVAAYDLLELGIAHLAGILYCQCLSPQSSTWISSQEAPQTGQTMFFEAIIYLICPLHKAS